MNTNPFTLNTPNTGKITWDLPDEVSCKSFCIQEQLAEFLQQVMEVAMPALVAPPEVGGTLLETSVKRMQQRKAEQLQELLVAQLERGETKS